MNETNSASSVLVNMNSTSDSNASVTSEPNTTASSDPSKLVTTSMLCTLTITGSITVLMNVFVLTVVWRYTWMRTNANLIIASMAVTDLVAGVSAIISGLVKWEDFFSVGQYFCLVYNIIDVTVAIASLQHVLAVNMERYLAVIKPLQYKRLFQRKLMYLYIVAIWIWSLGLSILYVLNMVILDRCLFDVPSNAVWSLVVLMLVYPVPLFTIISIYIHIIAVIIHQLNFLKKHGSGEIRIKSKQTKMIRSVGSIFAAYLICWAPTFCVLMAVSWALLLGIDLHLSNYVMMFYFVEVLSYANSLVNPCIYFLSSRSFQRAARIMFHLQDTLASTRTVTGTITEQTDSGRDYINVTDKITKI